MSGYARISEEAIERNRVSSLARYHRNKEQQKKIRAEQRKNKLNSRKFIGWDGEGYRYFVVDSAGECEQHHGYMLFGASTGHYITSKQYGVAARQPLTTTECLDLMLRVGEEYPDAFHVGFAFEYDVNMILSSLSWRHLAILKEHNKCRWFDYDKQKRYRIEHVPHKWFKVISDDISVRIYDAFGFFHSSYMRALKKYEIGTEEKLEHIEAGKAQRANFTYLQLDEVIAYWKDEISLLPPLMDSIKEAVHRGGYFISEWHGPGALAAFLLREQGAHKWHSKDKIPAEVRSAIRHAYAGGRFTGQLCGLYLGPVYTADRNSAYVYACSLLPRMDNGAWERQSTNDVDRGNLADFGLYHIEFDAGRKTEDTARKLGVPEPPYPLFHRSKNRVLRWPKQCTGWYWTPEARLVLDNGVTNARVLEAWIYRHDASKPFAFVDDAYARRLILQHEEDPAEKTYKWALAAMYGAFARRVGWNRKTRKAPLSHELAWAGYITSHCRAAVWTPAYDVWHRGMARGLISIDTDGITATIPFDEKTLDKGVGEGLGQWKLEEWTGILQWQNGIYWLRDKDGNWKEPKSRGIPKGSVPFDAAMEALERMDFSKQPFVHPKLSLVRTRFVGYSQALQNQFGRWRKWVTEPVEIIMGGTPAGKAFHFFAYCAACRAAAGGKPSDPNSRRNLHTITNTAPSHINSFPHNLPWLEEQPDLPTGFEPDSFKFIVKDEDM